MRHLLVKLFVLDYFFKVFGTVFKLARVNVIMYPLFIITGLSISFFNYPFLLWFLYLLNLVVVFFGFVYFRLKPVEWEELDEFQKLQYGSINRLKGSKYFEWVRIFTKLRKDYFN